ncbi:MAG: triphosphoribosyl-dephospho-CoA synthase CitG [Oscillospiraceae bacterium]|nr:triphosphoribosyl-dephospho-CoA synthase CitG [Oscillospiraceae bacterium]
MELQELLLAREARVGRQKELLEIYGGTLISFTMNIPGPVKNSPLITGGFLLGEELLKAQFPQLLYEEHRLLPTGCEGYYVVSGAPREVKDRCMELEERLPVGRLFDLDVLGPTVEKHSRSVPRPCLLCGEDARICRRSGKHKIEDLAQEANRILQDALDHRLEEQIGAMAVQSLLYELLTTPKPGLVDQNNTGSHGDMDALTFARSASALNPYFRQCALEGIKHRGKEPRELLTALRFWGREAEATMLRTTDGVNTHKGAIFSLGLLCAASGCLGLSSSPEELCAYAAHMVEGIVARELKSLSPNTASTKGEKLYVAHGITGIRGQAERGFPTVLCTGLPVFTKGMARGLSVHRAGSAALLAMLAVEPDTSLISRSSFSRWNELRQELKLLLKENPYPTEDILRALDEAFRQENLSPGGSADLLAMVYFLFEHRKLQQQE